MYKNALTAISAIIGILVCSIAFAVDRGAPPHRTVGLKNFPFDTTKGEPAVPAKLRGKPTAKGKPEYLIIKFKGKESSAARDRLVKMGVRLYGYVPVDAVLARVPPGRRGEVGKDNYVESVYDYRPAYRLAKAPLGWVEKGLAGRKKLVVQAFDGEDLTGVKEAVKAMGGSCSVVADGPGLNEKLLKVEVDASRTAELAALDGVQWVEEEGTPVFHNDTSAVITGTGYVWGLATPLTGTGQVVAVCDTGLGSGDTSTMQTDFSGDTSGGLPKVKQAFAYGRTGDWSDPHGHGTHVSGTAAGFGVKSAELVPGMYLRGMAFDAQLVMQSTLTESGGLNVPDLNTVLYPDAYNAGARVHSNSWGLLYSYGQYTYSARASDTYAWNHKDFLIVFSAGNDGVDSDPQDGVADSGSVGSPSTAKDVVSVGASENDRQAVYTTYGTAIPGYFPLAPINTDKMADNPSGMAAYSGRGPCEDGRIKPDIVAPGTYVLSDKSSEISSTRGPLPSKYGYPDSLDPYYYYMSGTSMSAPVVSGAAALVREYLAGNGLSTPSSALIKGLLIAGAADMSPGQYAPPENDVTARPDNNQGWGRLDLQGSLYPALPKRLLFDDHASGLTTDGRVSYTYTVADASVPVRVNLVWTDYPGAAGVLPDLVNDLDLIVTAPDGHVYHGNRYSGSASIPDAPDFDRLNNVEGVTIPASEVTTGALSVQVYAYNVPDGPQPYALVVYGGMTTDVAMEEQTGVPAAPQGLAASPGNASVNLTWQPGPQPDVAGYHVYFNSYSTTVGQVSSHRLTGLTNGESQYVHIKADDALGRLSPASDTVSATPLSPDPELPHYNYDASPARTCNNCHASPQGGTLLPPGFDYRYDKDYCMSCHNAASNAHNRPVGRDGSHSIMVNVTAGGSVRPTYGSVTTGEYSDAMYTHLKDGRLVVCATCHNAMRKPGSVGRAWEFTSTNDNRKFKTYRGGWWDQGHAVPRVYRDGTLWTPGKSKDREKLKVGPGRYTFNEYSGSVTFLNYTSGYVYITLDDPYLRAPGADSTICKDCHPSELTHEGVNCLACHGAHNNTNIADIKSRVRKPGGTYKDVVFKRRTGVDSFADGTGARDGICEVCHTSTKYYRNDGTGFANHSGGVNYDRADCAACHTHADGFGR